MKLFSEWLKEERVKAGLTQGELAAKLQISRQWLNTVENESFGVLPMKHWEKLADALGVHRETIAHVALQTWLIKGNM